MKNFTKHFFLKFILFHARNTTPTVILDTTAADVIDTGLGKLAQAFSPSLCIFYCFIIRGGAYQQPPINNENRKWAIL